MRRITILLALFLFLLFPKTGNAEWESFDKRSSFNDRVYDNPNYDADFRPGVYSCPEGTRFVSTLNAETLRYTEICERDAYLAVQDSDRDGVDDDYQSSFLTTQAAIDNPLVNTRGIISEDNPFLWNKEEDRGVSDYVRSNNPFIKDIRDVPMTASPGNLDESMINQVRNNIMLQEKIRNKLQGTPFSGQFDKFLGR